MTGVAIRHCEECGEPREISVLSVVPVFDGMHDVERVLLECGHVDDDPDFQLEDMVVGLLEANQPDMLEVVDE